MKKAMIQVPFEEEKLSAARLYMEQKGLVDAEKIDMGEIGNSSFEKLVTTVLFIDSVDAFYLS